jgi:SAM-dependent methyltransferase
LYSDVLPLLAAPTRKKSGLFMVRLPGPVDVYCMIDLPSFWRERAAKHGHTGWRDQVVYVYDQQERLRIVGDLLTRLEAPTAGGAAIDFGCGTGDFSRLLIDRGFEVCGYDPFIVPELDDPRFTYVGEAEALAGVSDVDVVLSVTVLDHVLDEAELDASLSRLRAALRSGGRVVLIEYALDAEPETDIRNGFQAFRTLDGWKRAFERNRLTLVDSGPVPHPADSPSAGYRRYRKKLAVRAMRRLGLRPRKHTHGWLKRFALNALRVHPPAVPHPSASPLKFMVCEGR